MTQHSQSRVEISSSSSDNKTLVVDDNNNMSTVVVSALQPPRPLRIGLINRKKTRRIVNINELERAIRHAYPQAIVERVTMQGMTPLQQ